MKTANLTIVKTTYNRASLLASNIKSLLDCDCPFELLIVDDASSDETRRVVESFDDSRIAYHRNTVNLGYPKSLNVGIEKAKHPQILLCEDDAFILNPESFFQVLMSEIQPKTIIASRLLANGKRSSSGLFGKIKRFFAESLAGEIYLYDGSRRRYVEFCNNCFSFNKDEIQTRFEEFCYIGNSYRIETDFQLRARKEGAKIIYNPLLVIDHRRCPTGGLRVRNKDSYLYQCIINHLTFLGKFRAKWMIYFYLFLRVLSFSPRWSYTKQAFKAYLSQKGLRSKC